MILDDQEFIQKPVKMAAYYNHFAGCSGGVGIYTIFNLITAPALMTPPPLLTLYFIFTYFHPHDDHFLTFFNLIFTYYHPLDDLLAPVVENKFT